MYICSREGTEVGVDTRSGLDVGDENTKGMADGISLGTNKNGPCETTEGALEGTSVGEIVGSIEGKELGRMNG